VFTLKQPQKRQCCFRTRSIVVSLSATETMTTNTDPLMGPLRSDMKRFTGSTFLLLTLTYLPTSNMASFTTPNSSSSQSSSAASSSSASSSSSSYTYTSSSPSPNASFLGSMTAFISPSDSGSSSTRTRSTSSRRETKQHRRRSRSRHHGRYRRRSSCESAGAQVEWSHRVRPSLRDLSQLS
jgi:hypothetical protein